MLQTGMLGNLRARTTSKMCSKNLQVEPNCGSWASNVPVRTAFLQHSTQVLPKLFNGRPAKKPVAIVDLEYNETRFEDDDMRDHRIVLGVRVLGDIEILL